MLSNWQQKKYKAQFATGRIVKITRNRIRTCVGDINNPILFSKCCSFFCCFALGVYAILYLLPIFFIRRYFSFGDELTIVLKKMKPLSNQLFDHFRINFRGFTAPALVQ